jgi:hypothetical protein
LVIERRDLQAVAEAFEVEALAGEAEAGGGVLDVAGADALRAGPSCARALDRHGQRWFPVAYPTAILPERGVLHERGIEVEEDGPRLNHVLGCNDATEPARNSRCPLESRLKRPQKVSVDSMENKELLRDARAKQLIVLPVEGLGLFGR